MKYLFHLELNKICYILFRELNRIRLPLKLKDYYLLVNKIFSKMKSYSSEAPQKTLATLMLFMLKLFQKYSITTDSQKKEILQQYFKAVDFKSKKIPKKKKN